jgi:hypothetical protein
MHYIAPFLVASKDIRHNLAEGLWEKALVKVPDGRVDIFFGSRNPSLIISRFGTHNIRFGMILSAQK